MIKCFAQGHRHLFHLVGPEIRTSNLSVTGPTLNRYSTCHPRTEEFALLHVSGCHSPTQYETKVAKISLIMDSRHPCAIGVQYSVLSKPPPLFNSSLLPTSVCFAWCASSPVPAGERSRWASVPSASESPPHPGWPPGGFPGNPGSRTTEGLYHPPGRDAAASPCGSRTWYSPGRCSVHGEIKIRMLMKIIGQICREEKEGIEDTSLCMGSNSVLKEIER